MKTATSPTHIDKTPVAHDIFTYCTKEKTDTFHVVMNHNARGTVDRVKCKACGSEHQYRSKTAAVVRVGTTVRRSPATSTPIQKSENLEQNWFQGIKKWGDKAALNFDPGTFFKAGDVVEHSVFGKGVVQTRRENKVDVLFKLGLKTLPSKNS